MNILHISEIVDLGIEKEKMRRDFYARAAKKFNDNKELKTLFNELTGWEEIHIKKFTDIRNALGKDEAAQAYPGELNAYMQTVVNEKLYSNISVKEFDTNITTAFDAIYYGIEFEKEAILFFNELLRYTTEGQKEVIQKLIDEEKQHIVFLALLQQKLIGQKKDKL
ncbi:MAG: ferritin family protein [Candidatus Omnitrophota bacterium]